MRVKGKFHFIEKDLEETWIQTSLVLTLLWFSHWR
jgi:hypothetical protein